MLIAERRTRRDPGAAGPGRATKQASSPVDVAVLADGSVVDVRLASSCDAGALREFYLGLGPSTLYRRFLTPMPRLPESTLAYLCDTERNDREVVVAVAGGAIVGEGRYHRLAGTDEAEVAFVVADEWQGLGLGRALSGRLARVAARRGIAAFGGSMLADNDAARGLLRSTAPGASLSVRSGELEFRSPLTIAAAPAVAAKVGVTAARPPDARTPSGSPR
jgi:GNAT superfamily N-acetyltransferase